MLLPAIIASDLHLTANPADEYRWGLFEFLRKEGARDRAHTLVLLGDLTDAKDYHPAQLVNRLVREIEVCLESFERVIIVRGNHDSLKDGHMFFAFLEALPGVTVVTKPWESIDGELTMFLPHTRTPAADWKGWDFSHYRYVFMHQTIKGAKAESGTVMEDGDVLPPFNAGKVYSGDIHVPQTIGEVEYIGAPYNIRYGDHFIPRCVLIDKQGQAHDLEYPSPARVMMDVQGADVPLDLLFLKPGDMAKVRVHLRPEEIHQWRVVRSEMQRMCTEAGVLLQAVEMRVVRSKDRAVLGDRPASHFDPAEAVYRYVEDNGLGGLLLETGLELITP